MINREIKIFLTAVLFFTRIPCPSWVNHSEEDLNSSSKYLPLIGIIIGGLTGLAFCGARLIFGLSISLILSMICSVLLTGAFHEDGLADMCDGFGGGWTKDKILSIMKDSQIGTFGAISLIFILAVKFLALNQSPEYIIIPILITGNSTSRWFAISFLFFLPYARQTGDSKSKAFSTKITLPILLFSGILGFTPMLILGFWTHTFQILWIIPVLSLITFLLGRMFTKWIGGFTGDCLGGTQQITEVIFYLGCVAVYH